MDIFTPDIGMTCGDVLFWWDPVASVCVALGFAWVAATARDVAMWPLAVVVAVGILGKLPVAHYCGM